jgi:hypothetical protein
MERSTTSKHGRDDRRQVHRPPQMNPRIVFIAGAVALASRSAAARSRTTARRRPRADSPVRRSNDGDNDTNDVNSFAGPGPSDCRRLHPSRRRHQSDAYLGFKLAAAHAKTSGQT